ncbi:MAG TPA: flagellar filament capping protein FliD [Gaiellales bacterium]
MSTGGSITFTGLSSGIDTGSIVTQLIAVESAPKTLLMNQQSIVNLQQQDYSDISTKLYTLKTAADALRDFTLYAGSPTATSSDPSKLTAAATSAAAASSYNVVVSNIARAAVSQQTATSDVSQFGTLYAGNGAYASTATKLTDLTTSTGAAAGYAVGDTITLASTQGGTASTASYTVSATSTVGDIASFMQKNMAGSTVSLQPGGRMQITSAPGLDQANTGVSLSGTIGAASSTQAATGNTKLAADGGMDISSSGIAIHVDLTAGMTMSDVAAAINAKNGTVTATTANGMLRLSATQTGAASAISISNVTGGASAIGLSSQVAGTDASGTVDGNAFTSASNTVTNAISGVTLNLTTATDASGIALSVNPAQVDNTAITTKVQAFVTAYNDVIKTATDEISEKKVINPTTDSDLLKGAMFGDSRLQSIIDSLRNAFISPVSGLTGAQSIASFAGLSTGAFGSGDTTGQLTLDTDALTKSLAGGSGALKALFMSNGGSSDTDGLMQRVSDLSWNAVKSDGTITSAIAAATQHSQDLQTQIDAMTATLLQRTQTMKDEFTAMETSLSNLKAMQSQLEAQLGTTASS